MSNNPLMKEKLLSQDDLLKYLDMLQAWMNRHEMWFDEYLVHNAIVLLKKQEAKPMIENERGWNCPSCGMNLIGKSASGYPCDLIDLPEDEPIHFCLMCGQAVKWE